MDNIRLLLVFTILLYSITQITGDTVYKGFLKNDAYPSDFYRDDPLPDKTAYLTFDGPTEWTYDILNTLSNENMYAAFFICAE